MAIPERIGGRKEGDAAIVVAIGPKKPSRPMRKGIPDRIGGPGSSLEEEDMGEDEGQDISAEDAFTDAITEMVLSVGGSRQSVRRFRESFRAAVMACKEMDEGCESEGEGKEEEGY